MKHNYSTSLCLRALALLLLACSSLVALAQNFTQNGVNYYIDGTTAYVASSSEATGDITILDKITVDGTNYPVTAINSYAFSYNTNITSVTIPNSVQEIQRQSFSHCDALVTVTIGSGVTFIGYDAFYSSKAVEDVYIYADPEALDWSDEGDCDDFKSDGSTIGHVADAAAWDAKYGGIVNLTFMDPTTVPFSCSYNESTQTLTISGTQRMPKYSNTNSRPWNEYAHEIKKIVIQNGVPNISRYAFDGCQALTDVVIPNSVQLIDIYAFSNCTSLTSINIPASVTNLAARAFMYCTNLTSINVASSNSVYKTVNGNVYSKDGSSFICCAPGKSSLTIENGTNTIGEYACCANENLTSLSLPTSVTSIEYDAFNSCTGLTSLNLSAVEHIAGYVFSGCNGLKEVIIPNNMQSIDYYAFSYCENLTSVHLGTGLSYLNASAFSDCYKLQDIYVHKDNPHMKSIGGVVYSKDGTTPIAFPSGRTTVAIPEGVTIIPSSFFNGFTRLTSVQLPSTLLTIDSYAFYNCDGLASIVIPNSVKTISEHAFSGCDKLTSVSIGSGVTYIGYDAFYASRVVEDVYLYADPNAIEEWYEGGYDDFMYDKATICHVFNANAYQERFGEIVRATFQGDLLPQVATENLVGSNITTYYNSAANVKVDAGTQVFKVSLTGSKLTATEIEDRIISAGEGVILKANDKIITMATTNETSNDSYSDNILDGVDVDTTKPSGYKYYTIGLSQGNIAFPEIPGKKLLAHKAFIKSTSGPSGGYMFDDVTGVSTIEETEENPVIYNLSGQRLNKMQPGINIVNGKKILMK